MNLIEIVFEFTFESAIVYQMIFDRFNFVNKKYKLVNHKKNTYKKFI